MHLPSFFLALVALADAAPLTSHHTKRGNLPGFYQPPATPVEIPASSISFLKHLNNSKRDSSSFELLQSAKSFATSSLTESLGLKTGSIAITHAHISSTSGIQHIYATQTFQGLAIVNAVSNTHIGPDGVVISQFQSFVPDSILKQQQQLQLINKRANHEILVEEAVFQYASAKGISTSRNAAGLKLTVSQNGSSDNEYIVMGAPFAKRPILASKKYYQTERGLALVWDLSIQTEDTWDNAFVDSITGDVIGVSNWASDYVEKRQEVASRDGTYSVIPIGFRNPNSGLKTVTNTADKKASPQGWHSKNDLSGNNVYAQSNPKNIRDPNQLTQLPRPQSDSLTFQYKFDASQSSSSSTSNRDAAVTNMFYVTNSVHDILYHYGFDEASGNFQEDNFGKGGRGSDAVIANAQDGSGTNNANFMTPPDGQNGVMRMYQFTRSTPSRDGALDNDVVIHELVHGLSSRLVGGAANANCLQGGEGGGMGEGWSDAFGTLMSLPEGATRSTDFATGSYVFNSAAGIRQFPYSTNTKTNPHMYSDLTTLTEVHRIGEVWATMLYEVMWNFIDLSGATSPSKLVSSANSGTGNTDFMKALISGMKLTPCNPSFIQARDAILKADQALFNGKYKCAIWAGFAKRGMGVKASRSFQNNVETPSEC
ncbi:Fungalysin metallopeptidase-domain-containing protein, partial [Obelidium mucronatum]